MRITPRFGIMVATTLLMLGAAGWAIAQMPGHGSMPGMQMEEKKETATSEAPHGGMEMPDPMDDRSRMTGSRGPRRPRVASSFHTSW